MEFYKNLEDSMKHLTSKGAFLTVKAADGAVNTMTISWGFIGYMWNKPQFITVVRPQRHTKTLLDSAVDFTISVPFGNLVDELKICGTKSGRDIDKAQVVNFIPAKTTASPVVDGCGAYYECKINYKDGFDKAFIPTEVIEKFYKDDYHEVFMGEILECYGN